MKKCRQCRKHLPVTEFHFSSWKYDGLNDSCKECAIESSKAYYREHAEERKAYAKAIAYPKRKEYLEEMRYAKAKAAVDELNERNLQVTMERIIELTKLYPESIENMPNIMKAIKKSKPRREPYETLTPFGQALYLLKNTTMSGKGIAKQTGVSETKVRRLKEAHNLCKPNRKRREPKQKPVNVKKQPTERLHPLYDRRLEQITEAIGELQSRNLHVSIERIIKLTRILPDTIEWFPEGKELIEEIMGQETPFVERYEDLLDYEKAIYLRHEGKKYREIADELGYSQNWVYKELDKAKLTS